MNNNELLITKFYTSFSKRDYKGMLECYSENVSFNDPVFGELNSAEVKAMWEMLCVKGKDLRIEFNNITSNNESGNANWVAYYTFSTTGKKVINHIKAEFIFKNYKIIRHSDNFNFYNWAKQALGFTGLILGWTPFLKNKLRKTALKSLNKYIEKS
ncbi:MAG TPA: nuclear transport factor 2 family protein [Saprospiraceae bacterium]|nr:nuclear transport factor 2 family protein [Saprospiraceae bacterium]